MNNIYIEAIDFKSYKRSCEKFREDMNLKEIDPTAHQVSYKDGDWIETFENNHYGLDVSWCHKMNSVRFAHLCEVVYFRKIVETIKKINAEQIELHSDKEDFKKYLEWIEAALEK